MKKPAESPGASRPERWLIGAGLALFLLSYPFLALFNSRALVAGLPLIVLYLFAVSGLVIGYALWARGRP